jgi:hypothetical protein
VNRIRGYFRLVGGLAGVAVIAIAVSAIAAGAPSKNLTLCGAKDGVLSLAEKGKCPKGEKKLTLAKQGPAGPQGIPGAPGADGAAGAAGTTASIQPEAVRDVADARPVNQGLCSANPGVFCGAPGFQNTWLTFPSAVGGDGPPVSYQKDAAGYVHLAGSGWQSNGAAGGPDTTRIFYLPAGYRPTEGSLVFAIADDCGTTTTVGIGTDGGVAPDPAALCPSLDGVTFHP